MASARNARRVYGSTSDSEANETRNQKTNRRTVEMMQPRSLMLAAKKRRRSHWREVKRRKSTRKIIQ